MNLRIFNDYATLSRATADLVADYIRAKPASLICLASGHSPKGVFDCLHDDVRAKRLSLENCFFISLDEWVGIAPNQKGSCREMMDHDFFVPLGIHESQIVFFDGMTHDAHSEVDRINQVIEKHGALDIMLVGVGTNGHIAMNEPGTSFGIKAHISTLAEETKKVGQKYFDTTTTLNQGLTLGLAQFAEAKLPILIANGLKKREIMKKVLSSPPVENLPASIIHRVPHAYVLVDQEAYGG